ncbi:MAG: xanthine dehydrogenase family protein subunit M [Mogibacterium sp.]|nr:xanthine dehydrogenase family protein subunit M [Mogibacterium sp.]
MILPEFKYVAPTTVEEAVTLLAQYGDKAKLMAGGTDLINFIKDGVIKPEVLIDLKSVQGMDQLEFDPEQGLTIGALTKLIDVERSEVVKKEYPALAEAVHLIASTQIRSKGTLVGNVCNASPSADSVPPLFVLGAELTVQGPEGVRTIPIGEFYQGFKKLALKPGEIVTAVRIPPMKANERAAYKAHTVRKAMDLAIVGVAAKLTVDAEGVCQDAKIALGAVAVSCVRAPHAESVLIGRKITPEIAEIAGQEAMKDCSPISDVRASAEYRHDMVRVFTKRAVLLAQERF